MGDEEDDGDNDDDVDTIKPYNNNTTQITTTTTTEQLQLDLTVRLCGWVGVERVDRVWVLWMDSELRNYG